MLNLGKELVKENDGGMPYTVSSNFTNIRVDKTKRVDPSIIMINSGFMVNIFYKYIYKKTGQKRREWQSTVTKEMPTPAK